MKVIENKVVVFGYDKPSQKVEMAYVNERWLDWKMKLNKFQLIKAILLEKGFIWKLGETVKYALLHSDSYRGDNSSEVVIFENSDSFEKLWYKKDI